jgi:hypothetical protein
MSTPAESFMTATTRTQEAATSALRSWADGWQTAATTQSALAEVPNLMAQYVDATRRVLAAQRQLAAAVVGAAQTMQSVTDQATRAAEEGLNALHAATSGLAGVANGAREQAAGAAALARSVAH